MSQLQSDGARGVLVREVDDTFPRDGVLIVVDAGAAVGDATLGRDVRHLGHQEARATDRA